TARLRGKFMAASQSRNSCQTSGSSFRVDGVDQRKRKIVWIGSYSARRQRARVFNRARVRCFRCQFPEQRQLALTNNAFRFLRDRAEDTAKSPVIVRNRTIGEGGVHFLRITFAMHDQEERFVIRSLILLNGELDARLDYVPDFRPNGGSWFSQSPWMLGVQESPVAVVIQSDQTLAPPHEHRLPRGQHDSHAGLEVLRPILWISERVSRPIERAHPVSHVAAAGEDSF